MQKYRGAILDTVTSFVEAGENEGHRKAGRLPDPGRDDGVNCGVAVRRQTEGEIVPAKVSHKKLDARVAAGLKQGTDYQCAQAPTDWGKPGLPLANKHGRGERAK